ncbi:hypothetical protein BVU17_08680 [Haloarcula taiwanensis]|uniref:DUF8120 domain-containing protein n=1 Tax=Haloarcula taiwanensis TaxID=1932004 RepID=A0A2H4ZYT5_9EURY|nr:MULTISPECIES: hypothetical protein [Haloarcula]AUG47587.1 hypothetical protein BVU17_08680 [Haloarcula taiwanensis]RLM33741.1 hypothetical protein DVK01_14710 [Haloarcula sp. Atlit-120R]RLM42699.1 hypothetical protein DVK00_16755 [Haloarcula sp. Atlit-47R]RLM95763.1 hypothetical protein D3D01_10310 [Haloarcula sp. Atlit-7R]
MTTSVELSERQYRLLDTTSKLVGLALVAAGLEVGGSTSTGIALAVAGTACATATVFITNE